MNEDWAKLPEQLPDDLRLRFATEADADAVAAFNTEHHDDHQDFDIVGRGIHGMLSGKHPTFRAGDFTVVEHTPTGRIVSSMCLLSQTWSYGGVPFSFGQPDFVATAKEYRRRGLVRKQFDWIHELSAQRGELMQGITGIPWYYSQFGYDMAMRLGGSRSIHRIHLRKEIEKPTCTLRPLGPGDEPFVRDLHTRGATRQPFAAVRSDDLWRFEFRSGRDRGFGAFEWKIIEAPTGERLGYLAHAACMEWPSLGVYQLELAPEACYLNVMPSLLRALLTHAQDMVETDAHAIKDVEGLHLGLGEDHPAYTAITSQKSREAEAYAWYVRIPDLVAFLRRVQPALERNLEGSPAQGYTGALEISFYRGGVRIAMEGGRITAIEKWYSEDAGVRMPRELFTQLLCGRRRCAELSGMFADVSTPHPKDVVLDSLFPPFTGTVWLVT